MKLNNRRRDRKKQMLFFCSGNQSNRKPDIEGGENSSPISMASDQNGDISNTASSLGTIMLCDIRVV